MGPFAATSFGLGTPTTYPMSPWGASPYVSQQPYFQSQQPYFQPAPSQSVGFGIGAAQPSQQILQLLQVVTQQLHQVQALEQQQLFYLQQLLQLLPAQLQQHQQQPWFPFAQGIPSPFGITPQAFAAPQSSHVM